jgi:hypothetical protein
MGTLGLIDLSCLMHHEEISVYDFIFHNTLIIK